MEINPQYICTSYVTTPMGFLLDPNISTTNIYTTMSSLAVEHDQVMVLWEESDLPGLPSEAVVQYASIMGVTAPTLSSTSDKQNGTTVTPQPAGVSATPPPMTAQAPSTTPAGTDGILGSRSSVAAATKLSRATGLSGLSKMAVSMLVSILLFLH